MVVQCALNARSLNSLEFFLFKFLFVTKGGYRQYQIFEVGKKEKNLYDDYCVLRPHFKTVF
jgi:hypothetical protein